MQPIQLDEFKNYTFLSAIEYAPGGKTAAFVAAKADMAENSYDRYIYLYEDGIIRRLTGLGKESAFTWLDSTHLIFPAVRSAAEKKRAEAKDPFTAYYQIDIHGGEAEPFFTLPFGAGSLKVLDENLFAVTGGIDVLHPDLYKVSEEERKEVLKAYEEDQDYEVFDELPFWFNGRGVMNKHRNALFIVRLEDGKPEITRLTAPEENAGGMEILGDELLYSSSAYTAKRPIYGFTLKAYNFRTGETRCVAKDEKLSLDDFRVADGVIYVVANAATRNGLNENGWVYTLDPETGALTLLRKEEYNMYGDVGSDCRLGGGEQSAVKGASLYHITTREGDAVLYRLDPNGSSNPVLTKAGSIDAIAVSPDTEAILLIAMYDMKLQELYAFENGELCQISHFNDAVLQDKYVAQPEYLEVESMGYTIGGWVLKPYNFDPEKTYPAVLDIHGGPKTAYGPVFIHEMQLWAGKGYFVFFCNPKGSDGRDSAFQDIRGDYGNTDYRNIMDFTDAVLKAYPQIDPKRVCETGGSYGSLLLHRFPALHLQLAELLGCVRHRPLLQRGSECFQPLRFTGENVGAFTLKVCCRR